MTQRAERDGTDTWEFAFDGIKHKVSYKSMRQERFDSKKFKEDNPALYSQYTKVIEMMRLTCK